MPTCRNSGSTAALQLADQRRDIRRRCTIQVPRARFLDTASRLREGLLAA